MFSYRKVAIIGERRPRLNRQDTVVDFFSWPTLGRLKNIRDYDVVVLLLLPDTDLDGLDWNVFHERFTLMAFAESVSSNGLFVVIGDPRTQGTVIPDVELHHGQQTSNFLEWTGLNFEWDSAPGDRIEWSMSSDAQHQFGRYLSSLYGRGWKYSLIGATPTPALMDVDEKMSAAVESGEIEIWADIKPFCSTRYGQLVAFAATIRFQSPPYAVGQWQIVRDVDGSLGPFVVLPDVGLSTGQTVTLLLQDLIGLEATETEPDWLLDLVPTGQSEIDQELSAVAAQLENLQARKVELNTDRLECRRVLRLLYEQGDALEAITRETLCRLGATIRNPDTADEDGRFDVMVNGNRQYAVIEVKGTTRDHHNMDGLRQLNDWKDKLTSQAGHVFKRIFLGNSAIRRQLDARPYPFPENWVERAIENKVCAMTTATLYRAYELDQAGRLSRDAFWTSVFETNGVLTDEALDGALIP